MNILVIRFKQIGDVLLTSVICNSLKTSFPDAIIDYLVYEVSVPLIEGQSFVDNVIGVSRKEQRNPFKYWQKIRSVCSKKYDIIIDTSSTAKSGLVSFMSPSANYRIGRLRKKKFHFYTHRVEAKQPIQHKISERLNMLGPLIADGMSIVVDDQLVMKIAEADKLDMRNMFVQHGIDTNRLIFVFAVSARIEHKKWNMSYLAEVANHCIDKYNAQIILYSGAEHEARDIEAFKELVDKPRDIFHRLETPTLKDLAALIANSDFFIGNECGPRHIAQALNIPSVAVFSPSSDIQEWLPSDVDRFVGIDWHAVSKLPNTQHIKPKIGDGLYWQLYNSIKPSHVKRLVDEVATKHLDLKP